MADLTASRSEQELIADIQRLTHENLREFVGEEPLALVDFPDIRNCGDSAIWLGEMAYLANFHGGKRPAYVSRIRDFSASALRRAVPDGPIFVHGGGNFGDIWDTHQIFREEIVEAFPDRTIVQFPQSIHFRDDARLEKAARIIGQHRRFVLLVRDRESEHIARTRFDCEVRLCPDMAFCIGAVARVAPPTMNVLAMLRKDREKSTAMEAAAPAPFPHRGLDHRVPREGARGESRWRSVGVARGPARRSAAADAGCRGAQPLSTWRDPVVRRARSSRIGCTYTSCLR